MLPLLPIASGGGSLPAWLRGRLALIALVQAGGAEQPALVAPVGSDRPFDPHPAAITRKQGHGAAQTRGVFYRVDRAPGVMAATLKRLGGGLATAVIPKSSLQFRRQRNQLSHHRSTCDWRHDFDALSEQ